METIIINEAIISKAASIINRNCLYKNKGWFLRYASKGWFYGNPNIASILEDIRYTLDEIHGENWEFFFIDKYTLPKINIIYPKLKITNSRGNEHTIRDIVITLTLKQYEGNLTIDTNIKGHRLTVSKEEYISGYQHSHLYPQVYDNYKFSINNNHSFCLGNNEIPEIIATFNDNQEIGTFELLILTLETMLVWESLEGTPYYYMREISSRASGNERYIWNERHGNTIFEYLKDSNLLSIFSYDMDINKIRILENDLFEDVLLKLVIDELPVHLCMNIEGSTNEYRKVINNNNFISYNPIYFIFKGQKIPFKIYNNRKTNLSEETMSKARLHPREYDVVVENLNNYLYEKCIVKYARENRR